MHGAPAPREPRAERLRAWLEFPGDSAPAPSADGGWVYLLSDRPGYPAAYRVPATGGDPTPVSVDDRRVASVQPAPEGPRVVVATDVDGNERWELAVLAGEGVPLRRLSDRPDRIHRPGAWRDGHRYVFSSNERDARFFDLWEVDLDRPEPPRILRAEDALVDLRAADGDRLLLSRARTNLDSDLLWRSGDREELLNPRTEEETVFDADLAGEAAYVASNPGREFSALFRYRPGGSTPERLREFDGDLETVAADARGARLALVENDRGYGRLSVYDLATAELRTVPTPRPGVVGAVAWSPTGETVYFGLSSPELGDRVFAAEPAGGPARALVPGVPRLPAPAAAPTLGSFRAEDGLDVPYWEYPSGREPSVGTIVHVHGGPESQARPGYLPVLQFLRDEGFRIVAPNVRGSLGYGRTYVHLDDVRRRMDSVRDLRDLVAHLSARDRAAGVKPGPYGVMGGSYGGFMVLAAMTRYPELFGAGVDVVGISNLVTFLERTAAWRRPVREPEYGSLARDADFLRSISPLHSADRIRAPLLVVHGANDPRVPLFEAEQIVEALRRRQVPVELLRFDDEGHGLARRGNREAAYARAAEFLAEHLAGGG